MVGRSRAFWSHYYPRLQSTFPEALGEIGLETIYHAINEVKPSEIRMEGEVLTYDLHILVRFELEVALVEGSLSVTDLPATWNAKMEEHFGIVPDSDAQGVLQDDHWVIGYFGYFPAYTVGNVLSAQFFEEAVGLHPEILREIGRGEFGTLRGWLRENIHRHGSRYYPDELIVRVTGRTLDPAPYLRYLRGKYVELYGL